MLNSTGAVLRRVRLEQGDCLKKIAVPVGVTPNTVSNIEHYRDVPPHWLPLLPAAYAIPISDALIRRHLNAIRRLECIIAEKTRPRTGESGEALGGKTQNPSGRIAHEA